MYGSQPTASQRLRNSALPKLLSSITPPQCMFTRPLTRFRPDAVAPVISVRKAPAWPAQIWGLHFLECGDNFVAQLAVTVKQAAIDAATKVLSEKAKDVAGYGRTLAEIGTHDKVMICRRPFGRCRLAAPRCHNGERKRRDVGRAGHCDESALFLCPFTLTHSDSAFLSK